MLEVKNLRASYTAIEVLHGINFHVNEGETVTILGANTAGKSTILRSISRLVPNVSGSVCFRGQELLGLAGDAIASLGISHVPEGRHVFPRMTVLDNLWMGGFSNRDPKKLNERLERVHHLFPKLKQRQKQMAGTLSGGEQQMVAIGRALMSGPSLLLLDEPSHGLAPIVVEEVHAAIHAINASGVAVLLVEQNAELALSVSSRGLVLEEGRIVLEGPAKDLRHDERVIQAYLGV